MHNAEIAARFHEPADLLEIQDAHAVDHLNFMHLGVAQARRGWMEKKHLLNTRTLKQLQKMLAR